MKTLSDTARPRRDRGHDHGHEIDIILRRLNRILIRLKRIEEKIDGLV